VRRFDHHCPWINNDVGEHNHRIFLMFLLSHVISCFWATADGAWVLYEIVVGRKLVGAVFMEGRRRVRANWMHIGLYLVNQETALCCIFLFTLLIGLLLLGFWGYQMYLVLRNVTSNDLNKIDDVMDFLWDQPTAGHVKKEAEGIVEKINRWSGRVVSLPPFPDCLREVAASPKDGSDAAATSPSSTELPSTELPLPALDAAQIKSSKKYRKAIDKVISHALKKTFHSGSYLRNLREVLFPYEDTTFHHWWSRVLSPKSTRRERLYGDFLPPNPAASLIQEASGKKKKK
jgi:hypothetical protein